MSVKRRQSGSTFFEAIFVVALFAGLLAFTAGTVFGIFGAGGSILLVPILVYVLDVPVKTALGMSLFILMCTGLLAALAHARSMNWAATRRRWRYCSD